MTINQRSPPKGRYIRADSFIYVPRGFRVYRVRQDGSGTILWLSRERMLAYLDKVETPELPALFREW